MKDLGILLESMYFIKRCKKFEYMDGVPTLTVDPEMYHSIVDRVDIANLRVAGGVGLGTVVSVCGVKLKLEE